MIRSARDGGGPAASAPASALEQSYRRLLRWYPREFRNEYEREMLGVLMQAGEDRRRPSWKEGMNLMSSGLMARLRPSVPRSARTVRAAVGLLYVVVALQVTALLVFFGTVGSVRSSVLRLNPSYTAAMWDRYLAVQFTPRAVFGVFAICLCLVLVQGIGRGRDWARQAYVFLFGVTTMGLLIALGEGAAVYAPADLTVGLPLWVLELSVAVLLFHPRSGPYFARRSDGRHGGGEPQPEPRPAVEPELIHRAG